MNHIDIADWRVRRLCEAIGVPYVWGAGNLRDAVWLADGYDCSGFAQAALVEIGELRRDAWTDKTAEGIAYACDPVERKNLRVGDLCFYGKSGISHVTIYIGSGMCIGANGGTPETDGDDPNACVQVRPVGYWSELFCFGRIKAEYRP